MHKISHYPGTTFGTCTNGVRITQNMRRKNKILCTIYTMRTTAGHTGGYMHKEQRNPEITACNVCSGLIRRVGPGRRGHREVVE